MSFPLYNESYPSSAFSLEAWVLPVSHNLAGEVTLIGHQTEGILWDGVDLIFRVNLKSGSRIESRWTPDQIQVFYIVLTFDGGRLTIFVNGERIKELEFPDNDTFAAPSGSDIKIHYLSNSVTSSVIYDCSALYNRALSDREVKAHYSWGNEIMDSVKIAMLKDASTWSLTYENVDLEDTVIYNSNNWDAGLIEGLSVVDRLIPDTEDGGTWKAGIPLGNIIGDTCAGVNLTCQGQDYILSYSLDGTVWIDVANKVTILEDVSADGLALLLRLTVLNGGWVDSLRVDILANRVMNPLSGNRTLIFKAASMDQTIGNQLDYQSDWGAAITNGGYVEAQPDVSASVRNVGSIELWAKVNDTDGFLIGNTSSNYVKITSGAYAFNGVTPYRNGVLVTNGSFPKNEWAHWVFVLGTANNNAIRIGGNMAGDSMLDCTVGHFAVYENKFSAADAQNLYKRNIGAPALRVDDISAITLTEDNPAIGIFAYSWSIMSGGR